MSVRPALCCAVLAFLWMAWLSAPRFAEGATATSSGEAASVSAAVAPPGPELEELRSENVKVYDAGAGRRVALVFARPVHFRSAGKWEEIDPTLVRSVTPGYAWANRQGPVSVAFAATARAREMVRVEYGGRSFRFGLRLANPLSLAVVDGPSVTYRDALPGVDVVYEFTGFFLKETFVIKERPAVPLALETTMSLEGLRAEGGANGSLALSGEDGGAVFRAPPSWMAEERGDGRYGPRNENVRTTVTAVANQATVQVEPDHLWLSSSQRRFPVVIDPSYVCCHVANADTWIVDRGEGSSGSNYADTRLRVGTLDQWGLEGPEMFRGLIGFDLSRFSGKEIVSANMFAWCDAFEQWENGDPRVGVHRVTSPWSHDVTWWNQPAAAVPAVATFGGACGTWWGWPLTSTVQSWVNGSAPNYGVQLRGLSEDSWDGGGLIHTYVADFQSVERANYMPHLNIEFNNTPPNVASDPLPASGATGVSRTSVSLSATYSDPDSDSGYVEFEFKKEGATEVVRGTGSTVASGGRSSWNPPTPLDAATRYCWRGLSNDRNATAASWSSWYCFTTEAAPLALGGLGLERYYQYEGDEAGGGLQHLVNVGNGNSLLRMTPFASPGRGLSTIVDLTYNSSEGLSESPVGHGWSLGISSLTRVGTRLRLLDGGVAVELVDVDGTLHRFEKGATLDDVTHWQSPSGVHLYLRRTPTEWAATRPDGVTFRYDLTGYLTSVDDRNGNRLTFDYALTPVDQVLGTEVRRLVAVTDAAGVGANASPNRTFEIDYYPLSSDAPAATGRVKRITDHTGSALDFEYDNAGLLRALVQRGGQTAAGGALADRRWSFDYAPGTTRIASVTDPRDNVTTFAYHSDGALEQRENRAGELTTYAYDAAAAVTTSSGPLGRQTTYGWDDDGKVVSIAEKRGPDAFQTTLLEWVDRHVTKVTEPSGRSVNYAYDPNGYLAGVWDQLGNYTQLDYEYDAADLSDTPALTGREQHISELVRKTEPEGTATNDPNNPADDHDFEWTFDHDERGNLETITDPLGHATVFEPNEHGLTERVIDANSNPTTFEYDANGLPIKITDAEGGVTQLGYDDDGLLRWVQEPNNAGATGDDPRRFRSYFDYDSFHRLGRQSAPKNLGDAELLWSAVEYDPNDNVRFEYGPTLATTFTLHADSLRRELEHDAMDRVRRANDAPRDPQSDDETQRAWRITELEYDDAGRLEQVTRPNGIGTQNLSDFSTRYRYDLLDRVLAVVVRGEEDEPMRETHYCYDGAGDLRSVTAPNAADHADPAERFVHCPDALTPDEYEYTSASYTTKLAYDAAHRLLETTDPEGRQTSASYDGNGRVKTETDEAGTTTIYTHDQRGQLVTVVEPFIRGDNGTVARALTTKLEYDPVGNLVRKISPRAWDASDGQAFPYYTTAYEYDGVNRLIKTTLPKGPDEAQAWVHRAYDPSGNLSWTSLPVVQEQAQNVPDGKKTVLTYFEPGWVKTMDVPDRPRVRFDYTPEGWQKVRTPENAQGQPVESREMTWTYFRDGLLKTRSERGGSSASYLYDLHGNIVFAEDGSGSSTDLATKFDATWTGFDEPLTVRDRLVGHTDWRTTTHEYDRNGNLAERTDQGRRHTFSYNENDSIETQLDYDAHGALERRITNGYFDTGRQKSRKIERWSGSWSTRQETQWTYFANGKLRTLETRKGGGTLLEKHTVSYLDEDGNYVNGHRTRDVFTLAGPRGDARCKQEATRCLLEYRYDGRGRLVREEKSAWNGAEDKWDSRHAIAYTLDAAGNMTRTLRTGQGAHDTVYTYSGNRLVQRSRTKDGDPTVRKYWYGAVGNLDCVTTNAGSVNTCNPQGEAPPELITDYRYDDLDRLEQVQDFEDAHDQATYEYDALDRPVRVVEEHGQANRETTLAYLGLSGLVSQETHTGMASVQKAYSYDAYGNRIGMEYRRGQDGAKDYTLAYDVHGSISLLLDEAGSVAASYGYTAYGEEDEELTLELDPQQEPTDATDPLNPYRYTGKRLDTGSGTLDMGARRFSPDIGRFLQEDFYGDALADLGLSLDPLTQNRYALAGGNPVSFVEVDGHCVAEDGTGSAHHASQKAGPPGCRPGASDVRRNERQIDAVGVNEPPKSSHPGASSGDRKKGRSRPRGPAVAAAVAEQDGRSARLSEVGHSALDAFGLVPGFGEVADLANCGWYYAEGRKIEASFSCGAAVPIAGWAATAGKYGYKAAKGVRSFEVGGFDDLQAASRVGDDLALHHAGQKHVMRQVVPGYDPRTAPAIAVPTSQHRAIPNVTGPYAGTARDALARDIRNLRNYTGAPNNALRDLIALNHRMYPDAFGR